MNWKLLTVAGVVVAGALAIWSIAARKDRFRPPVSVTLRIPVAPAEQAAWVAGEANSARFKYEVAKKAALMKPAVAQRLSAKPVPGSPLVEVQGGAQTKAEAQHLVEAFMQTLQVHCGKRAELALAQQAIR
jgi:hypothetical protein